MWNRFDNRLNQVQDSSEWIFVENSHDRIIADQTRWDNFDNRWNVSTRPHHFHSRYHKDVEASSMIGEPSKDMPILSSFILKNI